ncbi:resuscitation-promoting factor [Streptomyces sp. NRRL F-5123]|uniref:resuscitation-promoting factor n=1 Tax=Streptomyces sp. NRRL F-5123 TaxID=1463856 RepID=UPI000B334BBE|nr:resuscitation-promoting factor [Streptomyces sp. NRRL F-5123]
MSIHLAGNVRRLVPQALVVAMLAGGTGAGVAGAATVRLSVDGSARTVRTSASDVAGVLREQGIAVGVHDLVAPAAGHPLHDGDAVAVRYGRPLTLTLDGRRRRVWTTATTVSAALRQLGVRADSALLDASRGAAIGRRGLALDVRTLRRVTVVADGRAHLVRTHAVTARGAVADAGVLLAAGDVLAPAPDAFPDDGGTLTVRRIRDSGTVRREPLPYRTVRRADAGLPRGTSRVARRGRAGVRELSYAVRTVDGVAGAPRLLGSRIIRQPVTEVVRVGTGPVPARGASGAGGKGGGPGGGLDWAALAACESGGRPHAVDPSGRYGGLYQFDVRTWRSMGGRGRPQDAPAAEQTLRARRLYAARGTAPWPVCGRRLRR